MGKIFDCGFTKEENWFRYRAGAIIIENGCVLFAGNANEDYLYSIGGVHIGETAEDAVIREIFEETGVHYEIDRLAVIHENFFDENSGTLAGLNCHEISFYFMMKPRGDAGTSQQQLCIRGKGGNALDSHRSFGAIQGISIMAVRLPKPGTQRDRAYCHRR